jgi:hypothetical protein
MSGGSINNNTAANMGAGIYIFTGAKLNITGGSIESNTVDNGGTGGGVYNNQGTFTANGSAVPDGSLTVTGITISGNTPNDVMNNGG